MLRPAPFFPLGLATLASGQVEAYDREGGAPERPIDARLFEARRAGKVETVRTLLSKGANPNAIEANDWTPLMSLEGPPDAALAIARLLVAKGARVGARQVRAGGTALTYAPS